MLLRVEAKFYEGMRSTDSFWLLMWLRWLMWKFLKQIYLFLVSRMMSEDGGKGRSKFS